MNPLKIKDRLRHILHLDETPHELAKAFAVGVFVAFTPFLGLHTAIVLLLAWAFRLNKAVALTGTFVNNPWTIAFIYIGPTWAMVALWRALGARIRRLNYELVHQEFLDTMEQYKVWQPKFWQTYLHEFKPYVHAFLTGTMLAGALAAILSYFAALAAIKYYREEKEKLHHKPHA